MLEQPIGELNIQSAVTNIGGDTAAIRRAQQSSARYYQRPGRSESSDGLFSTVYDPTRTGLTGYGFYARLAKETGDWLWETTQNWRSPGFEANDMGVLGRADYKWMLLNGVRQWTTPGSWYRSIWSSFGAQQQINYEGDRTDIDYHGSFNATFRNYMNAGIFFIAHPSYYDDKLTRGGPTVMHYGYNMMSVGIDGDSRSRIVWHLQGQFSRPVDNTEGRRVAFYPSVTVKPSSLTVQLKDGRELTGSVYGIDTLTDLAIVKVPATGLPAAPIGSSSDLKVGQLADLLAHRGTNLRRVAVVHPVVDASHRNLLREVADGVPRAYRAPCGRTGRAPPPGSLAARRA